MFPQMDSIHLEAAFNCCDRDIDKTSSVLLEEQTYFDEQLRIRGSNGEDDQEPSDDEDDSYDESDGDECSEHHLYHDETESSLEEPSLVDSAASLTIADSHQPTSTPSSTTTPTTTTTSTSTMTRSKTLTRSMHYPDSAKNREALLASQIFAEADGAVNDLLASQFKIDENTYHLEVPENVTTDSRNSLAADLNLLGALDLKASLLISAECFGSDLVPVEVDRDTTQLHQDKEETEEQEEERKEEKDEKEEKEGDGEEGEAEGEEGEEGEAKGEEGYATVGAEVNEELPESKQEESEQDSKQVTGAEVKPRFIPKRKMRTKDQNQNVNFVLPSQQQQLKQSIMVNINRSSYTGSSSDSEFDIPITSSSVPSKSRYNPPDRSDITYDLEPQRRYLLKSSELFIPDLMPRTENIVSVQRVVQPRLAARFLRRWKRFKKKYGEDSLEAQPIIGFHGTAPGNVNSIIRWGLVIPKWYKIGINMFKSNGAIYGKGIYLGADSGTSLSYCRGGGKMFVVAALPGRRSERSGNYAGYDSVHSGSVLVMYRQSQVLPLYLVSMSRRR
eukprot:TRINITY_DN2748_c0_g1_i4.p1 TRINITY_DN2748_c0_g1~~TRINITY_DN2748_c0_g1_i4.p1  ORF type:complete len:559 (-),score=152.86 TRINITY_DN2748_c0_g1_i4:169-1845(-)